MDEFGIFILCQYFIYILVKTQYFFKVFKTAFIIEYFTSMLAHYNT